MHQVVRCRVGVDEVNVYLKANPTANKVAWGYYSRRNFAEMAEGTEAFPKVLRDCFVNEVDDSPLKDYLGFSNDLKWLTICLTREYFAFPQESRNQIVLKRLFNNPNDNTIDCPSVYAFFPGNLTYEEATFCTPTYDCYSGEFWDDKAFHPKNSIMEKYLFQGPSARLTWIDRCLTRKGDALSPDFVDIALGWLQRYCKAEIWSTLTIIPCKIMTEVSTMESLFYILH
ncbi:hypothetical protein MHU86_3034 [Fragilaria crotonensis]|nr:hypothetical protein MHU86_12028 [Fragilaria crotonensis]KAI2511423.1 hypothetical protein MHU86_3034 [Fragilaria crotonensis]